MSLSSPVGLFLTEIFCSVQGESSLVGWPTVFVRLSGCNLRCSWCDTPYSFARGKFYPEDEIVQQVALHGVRHVCITGGEPLLQGGVHPLMRVLCDAGYIVSLETGGSLSTQEVDPRVCVILDVKCPGSGQVEKNDWENLQRLRPHDEVKFVLSDQKDYLFARELVEKEGIASRARAVLFSPVHGVLDPKELVGWILRDRLPVRLNLQTHKYIWSPTQRGV